MFITSGQTQYAPALAEIHRHCFEHPWSESELATLLALPTTIGWVAEQGFLLCARVLDEVEILTICVLPEHRRQHIAFDFLKRLQTYALEQQINRIFLEVSSDNSAAQALYHKMGFRQTGIRPGYYQTATGSKDALCLTWRNSDQPAKT